MQQMDRQKHFCTNAFLMQQDSFLRFSPRMTYHHWHAMLSLANLLHDVATEDRW
jgi:hypothetical protein